MKRIIALLLSLSALMSTFTISASAEEKDYTHYLNFVQQLGIIEDVSDAKATVMRADFAEYLYNIVTGGAKTPTSDRFFVDDVFDDLIEGGAGGGAFDDISQSSEYYTAIQLISELGIMNGTGNRTFSPDSEIPFAHVATALIRLLGYSYKVQNGNYLALAEELGVYDNMSYSANDKITLEELAQALYNCFEIDVVAVDLKDEHLQFYPVEDLNIYQEFMGVYRTKGQLTKTPYTSIYGDSNVSRDTVVIDGVQYTAENYYEFYDLIGRDVEVYYKEDKYGEKTIIWGYATGRDEIITISADDFSEFDPIRNEISYYEGEKLKTEKFALNTSVIYNGIYYGSNYDNSLFDIDNGDITIIKPMRADDFSVAIINDYKTMKVTRVDNSTNAIYARQYYGTTVTEYVLKGGDIDAWRVQYYLADGSQTELNSISAGMVIDVLENGNQFVKVIATSNILAGVTIKSISGDDNGEGTKYTFSDGQEYVIPKSYLDALKAGNNEPKLGTAYNVAINSFGKIAYIEEVVSTAGSEIVYVLDLRSDEFTKEYAVEYLNSKNEIVLSYIKLGASVTVDTNVGRESFKMRTKKEFDKIKTKDGSDKYSGVAQIKKDEEGLITELNLPINDKKNRDNVFGTMFEKADLRYNSGRIPGFENLAMAGNAVTYIVDPTPGSDVKKNYRAVSSYSTSEGNSRSVSAYNFDSTSAVANCRIIYDEGETTFTNDDAMYIITDIYEGIYDEEPALMVKANTCNNNETEEVLIPVKGDAGNNCVTNASTFFDRTRADIKLKKGDIIYATIEGEYISEALLVYRIFHEEDESPLFDTTGRYRSSQADTNIKTNPYGVGSSSDAMSVRTDLLKGAHEEGSISRSRSNAAHRFLAGHVYNFEENEHLTFTTQPINKTEYDIRYKDDAEENGGYYEYITETMCLPYRYMAVDVDGRNISIRQATASDIITYMQAGFGCSELFIDSSYGTLKKLVIINRAE